MHCRMVRLKRLRYHVPHQLRPPGDQAGMVPDVQQRKSGQHRDPRHREGCILELTPTNMQPSTGSSHGKRLVKVHMTNITTAGGRVGEADLSIQIRSVEVDLTTVTMDDVARLPDAVLEHAKCRWVCDLRNEIRLGTNAVLMGGAHHESCEVIFVLLCLRAEVWDVEATVRQTLYRDHL